MYSYSVQTDSQGHFVKVLGLQPINNTRTPYAISASFEGDTAVTATAEGKTLEGQDYPACTTIQYNDYKPSANSTTMWVEPPASQVTTPTKTPEQTQKEAEQEGLLHVWPEFSWSYPWLRVHAKVSFSFAGLDLWLHIGVSPFLPDDGVVEWSNDLVELFGSLNEEVLEEMWIETAVFGAMYISALIISFFGRAGQPWLLPVALGLIALKFVGQFALLYMAWNDKVRMFASGIVNTILALLACFRIDVVLLLIESVAVGMSLSVASDLRWMGQQIKAMFGTVNDAFKKFRDYINIAEITGDALLGIISIISFGQL